MEEMRDADEILCYKVLARFGSRQSRQQLSPGEIGAEVEGEEIAWLAERILCIKQRMADVINWTPKDCIPVRLPAAPLNLGQCRRRGYRTVCLIPERSFR